MALILYYHHSVVHIYMAKQRVAPKEFDPTDRHTISTLHVYGGRVLVLVVCTMLPIVLVAEPTHFNQLTNLHHGNRT